MTKSQRKRQAIIAGKARMKGLSKAKRQQLAQLAARARFKKG